MDNDWYKANGEKFKTLSVRARKTVFRMNICDPGEIDSIPDEKFLETKFCGIYTLKEIRQWRRGGVQVQDDCAISAINHCRLFLKACREANLEPQKLLECFKL